MALLKLHFIWIGVSQLDLPTLVKTWHPAWCMKCWQGLPPTQAVRSPPTLFFIPALTAHLFYPDYFFCIGGVLTFQTVSFLKTSSDQRDQELLDSNTSVVSAWFLLETTLKPVVLCTHSKLLQPGGMWKRVYRNAVPPPLTHSTPGRHHIWKFLNTEVTPYHLAKKPSKLVEDFSVHWKNASIQFISSFISTHCFYRFLFASQQHCSLQLLQPPFASTGTSIAIRGL